MNFRKFEIIVCRDCAPVSKNIRFYSYTGPSLSYACGMCKKKKTTMGFASYSLGDILRMEADAHYQEQLINKLKSEIKALEEFQEYKRTKKEIKNQE